MDTAKLHLTVGPHVFDAEGSPELVDQQFKDWRALIEKFIDAPAPRPAESTGGQRERVDGAAERPPIDPRPPGRGPIPSDQLSKVFAIDERRGVVAIRVPVEGAGEATLLALYGFLALRQIDAVTTSRVMDSLELSGQRVPRIDRYVAGFVRDGFILQAGRGRSTSYRLTTLGVNRAEQRVRELIVQLP